jgi:hypothetical protein
VSAAEIHRREFARAADRADDPAAPIARIAAKLARMRAREASQPTRTP